jgi:hypothetical protein
MEKPEPFKQCRKQYNVKFLGGAHAFLPEQLSEAVRAASGVIVGTHGDPGTSGVSEAEKNALRDVLDALGLVRPDDPQKPMGGRTMSSTLPVGD